MSAPREAAHSPLGAACGGDEDGSGALARSERAERLQQGSLRPATPAITAARQGERFAGTLGRQAAGTILGALIAERSALACAQTLRARALPCPPRSKLLYLRPPPASRRRTAPATCCTGCTHTAALPLHTARRHALLIPLIGPAPGEHLLPANSLIDCSPRHGLLPESMSFTTSPAAQLLALQPGTPAREAAKDAPLAPALQWRISRSCRSAATASLRWPLHAAPYPP